MSAKPTETSALAEEIADCIANCHLSQEEAQTYVHAMLCSYKRSDIEVTQEEYDASQVALTILMEHSLDGR